MKSIEDYAAAHSAAEPSHLARLYRRTQLTRLYPRMCCDHLQGRLLKMLVGMINPQRVLEIGTFSGYSTLCLAEGMAEGGVIDTIEIDDEAEEGILEAFGDTPGITLHIGDALDLIPELFPDGEECLDLVYIDGNKRSYREYYELVKPRLRRGGYILADNTLWSGKVLDLKVNHDSQTVEIDRFNCLVASDPDVETVMLPIADGLTIIRKIR